MTDPRALARGDESVPLSGCPPDDLGLRCAAAGGCRMVSALGERSMKLLGKLPEKGLIGFGFWENGF